MGLISRVSSRTYRRKKMSQDYYREAQRREWVQCKRAYNLLHGKKQETAVKKAEEPLVSTDELKRRAREHYLSHFDNTNDTKGIPAKLPERYNSTSYKQQW